jgi:PhnB protein
MRTVTPYLWFNGNAKKAIDFYEKGLGGERVGQLALAPDGMVMHAMLKIGDSFVMLSDTPPGGYEQGPKGGTTASLWLFVENCDDLFARAITAGAIVKMPLMDQFWGDRMGSLQDPFGHVWMIATHQFDPTPDEMKTAQEEFGKATKK